MYTFLKKTILQKRHLLCSEEMDSVIKNSALCGEGKLSHHKGIDLENRRIDLCSTRNDAVVNESTLQYKNILFTALRFFLYPSSL